jgi:type II secretory pathway component PulF
MASEQFIGMLFVIALFTGTGVAVLYLTGSAAPGRGTANLARERMKLLIVGAFLLVGGICLVTTILAALVVRVIVSRLGSSDAGVEIIASLAAGLFLSLFPLAGGLLLGASGLVARERTEAESRKLYRYLDGLTVVGWTLTILGVVFGFFCLPLFGLLGFFFIVVLLTSIFSMRRSAQRNGLLWVLAIAARKKMPLALAVRDYADQCRGRYRSWVLELADSLAAGVSLPDALEARRRLLSPEARLAATVGWETGELAEVLRAAAVSQNLRQPVWHGVTGRLLYLSLPLLILQAVGGFLIYFIAPKFRKIFFDFGVALPASTELICSTGTQHVAGISLPFLILIELGLALCILLRYMGWSSWNLPLLDRIFRSVDRAIILRTLAVFVERQRTIVQGLQLLEKTYPKIWIQLRLALVLEALAQGRSWSESMRRYGLIRRNDAILFESAQRAGNLAWALREIADRDERRLGYRLQVFTTWLFPAILLTIGGFVFVFVIGFFQPLIRLITELSG